MELRQLRYFIAVAEERHFGRAAERLRIAQPALSQQIRQMEDQLEVTLLERTTRRVDLTPAGQELLDRGRRVLAEVDALTADVSRLGSGATGVLRLGATGAAACAVAPGVTRHVTQALPGVGLELQGEMLSPELEAGLRDHSLDLALLHPPVASSGIEHRVIRREQLLVAVPEGSFPGVGGSLTLEQLQDRPVVCWPLDSVIHRAFGERCRAHGFLPRIAGVATALPTMLAQVAGGAGIAVVPETARALRLPGVEYAQLDDAPGVDLALAWRREDRSAVLRAVVELVLELSDAP